MNIEIKNIKKLLEEINSFYVNLESICLDIDSKFKTIQGMSIDEFRYDGLSDNKLMPHSSYDSKNFKDEKASNLFSFLSTVKFTMIILKRWKISLSSLYKYTNIIDKLIMSLDEFQELDKELIQAQNVINTYKIKFP